MSYAPQKIQTRTAPTEQICRRFNCTRVTLKLTAPLREGENTSAAQLVEVTVYSCALETTPDPYATCPPSSSSVLGVTVSPARLKLTHSLIIVSAPAALRFRVRSDPDVPSHAYVITS